MPTIFDPISIQDQHYLLASHLPSGVAFSKAFDAEDDFGKLILGLAYEFNRFQLLQQKLYVESQIPNLTDMLEDWEKTMLIPNDCFSIKTTDENRRLQIEQLFSNFGGVQKSEDLIRVALAFGAAISITPGEIEGSIVDKKRRSHTVFIDILISAFVSISFPLEFPILFEYGILEFLQCIFSKLMPANVEVIIENRTDEVESFGSEDEVFNFVAESGQFFIPE